MNKQLAITEPNSDDADIAAIGAVARDLLAGDFVGVPLKFQKGKWIKAHGKDNNVQVGATAQFAVDVRSYAFGRIRWENKRPTHKLLGRPIDGFVLPAREPLGDNDQNRWPTGPDGKRQDPWQETHQITMRDLDADELVTWVSATYGGRKTIGNFLKTYAAEAKQHPGQMPIVLLSTHERPHPDFGTVSEPVLTIVDWEQFGEGAAPRGTPLAAPSAQFVTLPAPRDKRLPRGGDMDDEIPF
jgi:hypothetical protein